MQRGGKSGLEHALHRARQGFNYVFRHPDTVWCQSSLVQCPDDWKINEEFPEIPRPMLEGSCWKRVCSRPLKQEDVLKICDRTIADDVFYATICQSYVLVSASAHV